MHLLRQMDMPVNVKGHIPPGCLLTWSGVLCPCCHGVVHDAHQTVCQTHTSFKESPSMVQTLLLVHTAGAQRWGGFLLWALLTGPCGAGHQCGGAKMWVVQLCGSPAAPFRSHSPSRSNAARDGGATERCFERDAIRYQHRGHQERSQHRGPPGVVVPRHLTA